jgi:hypothetical protein
VALEDVMTTISFGLSALFPGEQSGRPWDASWTAMATALTWTDTVLSQVPGGVSQPLSTSYGATNSGFANIAEDDTAGQQDQDTITVSYGVFSVPAAVTVVSFLVAPVSGPVFTEQDILLDAPWNSIKDIEVSAISADYLHVTGFVDTWINASTDNNDRSVGVDGVKRGNIALGDGNDFVQINVAANEYSWSSHFDITLGNGNDTVNVLPDSYSMIDSLSKPAGWTFNSAPQLTTANITVGNGNDTVQLMEISGTIHVGSGNDTIAVNDGNSNIWLGAGRDTVTIGAMNVADQTLWNYDTQVGSSVVHVGSGHADITIDDSFAARTPRTTIDFIHGETGGSTPATADVVRYGHSGGTSFAGSDLSALTIDLIGYSPGSIVLVGNTPPGQPLLLQVHDAMGGAGSFDAIMLYAGVTAFEALQHVHFA